MRARLKQQRMAEVERRGGQNNLSQEILSGKHTTLVLSNERTNTISSKGELKVKGGMAPKESKVELA